MLYEQLGRNVELKRETIEAYLTALLQQKTHVLGLYVLGESSADRNIKSYGYGVPVRIDYETAGHGRGSAVLHTIHPGPFGHEHMADRAQILLSQHQAFNRMRSHVRSLDVGAFDRHGTLLSLGDVEELCLLTEYVEGEPYAHDLERIGVTNQAGEHDLARADALCDYLVDMHRVRVDRPGLYTRRIRELVGHGECVMGLTDAFPPDSLVTARLLEEIEHRFVAWRWRLKPLTHRLREVHGDFHPWNILFGPDGTLRTLDRSRGEFGEPADDVACLTINYLFFSIRRFGKLEGGFEALFRGFWERYLERSGDAEMLKVVAPFFAFRGLVLMNPLWYPNLPDSVRSKLLAFTLAVLNSPGFDPTRVNDYCAS